MPLYTISSLQVHLKIAMKYFKIAFVSHNTEQMMPFQQMLEILTFYSFFFLLKINSHTQRQTYIDANFSRKEKRKKKSSLPSKAFRDWPQDKKKKILFRNESATWIIQNADKVESCRFYFFPLLVLTFIRWTKGNYRSLRSTYFSLNNWKFQRLLTNSN